jgi:endoglucanase
MELKKKKWECRYVEEYLVVGEAPEQVRNCFQQRSRWCKGHFQIVFGPKNPLLQKELSWPMKIMYCSGEFCLGGGGWWGGGEREKEKREREKEKKKLTRLSKKKSGKKPLFFFLPPPFPPHQTGVWSYFVGAMTTPLFMLIPILTIWAGMFPIVVSKWAAGALTVYVLGQSAVLNFMHKRTHAFPIFFATVANNILWWTFIKACWKSLLSLIPGRAKITFKTTMKGAAGRLANSAIGDLWMPTLSFLALAVTLGIGVSKLAHGPTVVTTLSISVVWIIYSMISPTLLLIYALGMRGRVLAAACKVCFLLSYVCSLLALMLLWAVYPAEYDYGRAAGASLRFYEAQRLGELPAGNRIAFRGNTFPYERSPKFRFDDLTGGWASGGAVGTVKMTITTAFTTSMLAWGLLTFPKGYSRAGETRHALDSIKWGSDYLLKTFHPESGRKGGYTMVYQVGNLTTDFDTWATPENMTEREVRSFGVEDGFVFCFGVEKEVEKKGLSSKQQKQSARKKNVLSFFLFLSFFTHLLFFLRHHHLTKQRNPNRCAARPTSSIRPTAPRTLPGSSSAHSSLPPWSSASTATTPPTTTS